MVEQEANSVLISAERENEDKSFYSLHTQIPWLEDGSRQMRGCWVGGTCVAPVGVVGMSPPNADSRVKEPGTVPCPERRHPAASASRVSGLHWPVACQSTGGPFVAKAPIVAARQEASLSSKTCCLCSIGLYLKLINPDSTPLTGNCTSQSRIFK